MCSKKCDITNGVHNALYHTLNTNISYVSVILLEKVLKINKIHFISRSFNKTNT